MLKIAQLLSHLTNFVSLTVSEIPMVSIELLTPCILSTLNNIYALEISILKRTTLYIYLLLVFYLL